MRQIIMTADRPTGRLHIGHYVGSLRRRVELQNSGEYDHIFIMIALILARQELAPFLLKREIVYFFL